MQPAPFRRLRLGASDLDRQIEQLFSDLIEAPWRGSARTQDWAPQIDVYETDDAYLIEADLPGVRPEHLSVEVEGNHVRICGARTEAEDIHSGRGVRRERWHGRFCREFTVAVPVDPSQANVKHEQGVYHIHLPKRVRMRDEG
jgi:HSP20 family protein